MGAVGCQWVPWEVRRVPWGCGGCSTCSPPTPLPPQFELGAFMPNSPAAMREPPPRTKAPLGEGEFLAALPAMNTSAITLGVLWVLRNEPFDMVRDPPSTHHPPAPSTPPHP